MRRLFVSAAVMALVALFSAHMSAQRGGRGGGGARGGGVGGAAPTLLTVYDSTEYAIKFPAPPEFSIFTPEYPGRFRQIFRERRIIYLVDLVGKATAAVTVRVLPKATEADLTGFRTTLDSNPPQAKLPEYRKISLAMIKIGAAGNKDAVDYVYTAKEQDALTTTRQVVFIHKDNGFIFSCAAPEKDYPSVDKKSFQPLFASIEFK